MTKHTVAYTEVGCVFWQYFVCMADSGEHAEEQCMNAHSGCSIDWVWEGEPVNEF